MSGPLSRRHRGAREAHGGPEPAARVRSRIRWSRRCLLAVSLFWLVPKIALAALPEWAETIAAGAPQLEERVYERPYRVLFKETFWRVGPDGSMRTRWRVAKQCLSAVAAESVAVGSYPFDSTAKVKNARAYHVPAGEKGSRSWGPMADLTVGSNFLTDVKARFVIVPKVKRGSLVFFEFEAAESPVALTRLGAVYDDAAIEVVRFVLEIPQGWALRWAWLRQPGPEPQVVQSTWTWELKGIPEPIHEPLGMEPADASPLLALALLPPAGANLSVPAVPDWAAVSSWWTGLAKGRDVLPREAVPGSLNGALGSDRGLFAKARRIETWVRDSVRYIDVEIGIGGYQPRPASDTLSNLYGDCKDKSVLLRALLASADITSYPVLINASRPETVAPDAPTLESFNHAVTAIVLPAGADVPSWAAPAAVDGGDLGRLLVLDSTEEAVSPGSLPVWLAGKKGLVVAAGRGRLVSIPEAKPEFHTIDRRFEGTLSPDRSYTLRLVSRFFGQPAILARHEVRESSQNRRKEIEHEIASSWVDAKAEAYTFEAETPEGLAVESVTWKIPSLPESGAEGTIPLFPHGTAELPRASLGHRKTAVHLPYPLLLRYESTIEGVPEAYLLPMGRDSAGDGWSSRTTCTREGGRVRATWELRVSRVRFEPADFPALRGLWGAAAAASVLALHPPGPPSG